MVPVILDNLGAGQSRSEILASYPVTSENGLTHDEFFGHAD